MAWAKQKDHNIIVDGHDKSVICDVYALLLFMEVSTQNAFQWSVLYEKLGVAWRKLVNTHVYASTTIKYVHTYTSICITAYKRYIVLVHV